MATRKAPPPLQKLRRARLSDQAAAELKKHIASGTYAAGSQLPTEKRLAEDLGCTRLTIREALSQLEASGLTTTVHGSGTYVVDLAANATFGLVSDLVRAGRRLDAAEAAGLMQFREIVVGGFADLLVAHVHRDDLAELRTILREAREARGRPRDLARLDYRFNVVLARASGNSFYVVLIRSLEAIHLHLGELIFRTLRDDDAILTAEDAIVDALAQGSAQKLRRALATYLEGGTRVVNKALAHGVT
jgi:DNA-binding FadR family transcriptional regulator